MPARSSFHSLKSLWPHSLSFPPPPVASPVIFLVSWEPRARPGSHWCHHARWPGASLDNSWHHPDAPSLPLGWL